MLTPKASDLVLVPETEGQGQLKTPRVIAWRLSPKGHEILQSQPLKQRNSAYENIGHVPRTIHYTTASQQEVTSPVSHFVSSRNEANLNINASGRHSADAFIPRSAQHSLNQNGRHSADLLDDHYSTQPPPPAVSTTTQPQQRMFSSQQNLSTYQPVNGYSSAGSHHKPKSHISRRDQSDVITTATTTAPSLRQQFRPRSSDDVRWENYLGMAENGGRAVVVEGYPRDNRGRQDAYPLERYQTEEYRNVSSSWENLYDSADLSMVRSETHQVNGLKRCPE